MAKPTLQDVHVKLEKHLAVSDERWKETILRIKRMEHIMIATSGTANCLSYKKRLHNQTIVKGKDEQTYQCLCKLVPKVDPKKVKVY